MHGVAVDFYFKQYIATNIENILFYSTFPWTKNALHSASYDKI